MPTERFLRLPKEKIEAIRIAAAKEFMRVPLEEASINRIVHDADISRGSFYTYFEDKQDLLKWLIEILGTMKQYKLEPKRMKMVHPFKDKDANMVLIEAVRGGGTWMKVEAPVIVYKEPGVYTDEIYSIYGY